jgi:hypothetical protein
MTPSVIVRKSKRFVTKPFCDIYHYENKFPTAAMFHYEMVEDDEIVGVAVFGSPASPWVSVSATGKKQSVLELQRLALKFNRKNEGTWFLARVWKLLEKEYQGIIVSYSDTGQNHHGGVYQAFGFNYAGCSRERTDMYSEGHSRHHEGDKNKRKFRTSKHRYWLSVPRFKFDDTMTEKWKPQPYPKPKNG